MMPESERSLERDAQALALRRSAGDLPAEISPADLYGMVPQAVERDLSLLNGCYYAHLPEVDLDGIEQDRVEVRVIRHIDWDYRRFWRLATVWFDGEPVMVVKNAGREGDDHFGRFITAPQQYWAMVGYLRSLQAPKDVGDMVDAEAVRGDLTRFYGWAEGI